MAVDKLVDSTQLDADLTSVANAIRTRGDTSAQLTFPNGFVDAIEAIPSGGVDTLTAALNDELTSFNYDGTADIPPYLFCSHTALTSISLPNTTKIGEYSFYMASSLTSISIPNVTLIDQYAFMGLMSLIGKYFLGHVTEIKNNGFRDTGPEAADYDRHENNGIILVLPAIITLRDDCLRNVQLDCVDLGAGLTAIPTRCFYRTGKKLVDDIVLRKTDGIVPLSNSNGMNGGTPQNPMRVYVPQSLISSYETATNWSIQLTAGMIEFHAIEGSKYENYYADGTPIT